MKRRLLVLNIVLAALAALLAYRIRQDYKSAQAQEQKVLSERPKAPPPPAIAAKPPVRPIAPAQYYEVAQKMLFSADRNPNAILDPVKTVVKPVPPFPAAHGVMIFGDVPPTIILSEAGKGDQKGYQAGDMVGQFKIVSLDNTDVVFEWDGKQYNKTIAELVDHTPPPAQQENTRSAPAVEPVATTASAATANPVRSASPASVTGPGTDIGGGLYACQAGDNLPEGTVQNGMKKVLTGNPFSPGGKSCHWEAVK